MFLFLQSDQQLDCALDLMRRLPPQQIEKNLSDLIDLVSTACSNQIMTESWVWRIWYVRTFPEASPRYGDLQFSPPVSKWLRNCPQNARNPGVCSGQTSRYCCECMEMLLGKGSSAPFSMELSSTAWRLLFIPNNWRVHASRVHALTLSILSRLATFQSAVWHRTFTIGAAVTRALEALLQQNIAGLEHCSSGECPDLFIHYDIPGILQSSEYPRKNPCQLPCADTCFLLAHATFIILP